LSVADHLGSTATHEAGHAAISCLLGEELEYIELLSEREGLTMPFYSPCRICGSQVPDRQACATCLRYYEKHNPKTDGMSRRIERGYRVEGAVAAAGEIAESKFGKGKLLASASELEGDRNRVLTRSSLRHLWRSDACINYCTAPTVCGACVRGEQQLRASVQGLLNDSDVWNAVRALAEQVRARRRLSGTDTRKILEDAGLRFGSRAIDTVWPFLR